MDNLPSNPKALLKYAEKKNAMEVDQFPFKEWVPETKQMQKEWKHYRDHVITTESEEQKALDQEAIVSINSNLIDYIKPFVNKRGVRDKYFTDKNNEVRLLQLDTLPGHAKLVFRNPELRIGAMVPVYIQSRETAKADIEQVSKKLYKKAKKIIF